MAARTCRTAALVAAVLLVLSGASQAACDQWDLKGLTRFKRSDGVLITLKDLRLKGTQVTGRASWSTGVAALAGTESLEGVVVGDRISFKIYPARDPTRAGSYSGRITGTGRVEGTAEVPSVRGSGPATQLNWASDAGAARCPSALTASKVVDRPITMQSPAKIRAPAAVKEE